MDPTRLAKEDYAGWWQRLGGSILDGIIFLIPLVVVVGIIIGIAYSMDSSLLEDFGADPTYSDPYGYDSTSPGEDAWILGALGAYVLYLLAWDVLWIRSRHMGRPGQILAGYRVVRLEGTQRLGLGRASARAAAKLCYNVPSLGPLASLTSAFTIGLTEHKQGLHDLISGTVCVRTSALERRGLIGDGDGAAAMTAPTWSPVTGGPVPPAPPAPPRPSDSGPFV
ncbi:MAG: hypothetical protein JWM86_1525 [Thermoleophilia bacterium]|nr:hypothetical protein [Thermoleophilia bacterium]